jgi:multiple sugar transport system permease protein/putative aldouronate transport system permease protein
MGERDRTGRLKKTPEQLMRGYQIEKAGDITFNIFNAAFFVLFTLICIFPFYYLFINTISANDLVQSGRINLLPRGIHFENYIAILRVTDLQRAALITTARTVLGTVSMVLASSFVGYLVTKTQMFGRKFVYRFIVITMYFNAGLIPWYMNMDMLGLTNNFWGYVIPTIVAPFNIILVKTYIESLPKELEESAFMDGAGYFTTFRVIIFPLCKPILATIAIFGAVGHWNAFTDSIILMSGEPELFTLQHRLYDYLQSATNIGAVAGGNLSAEEIETALNSRVISLTVSMVSIIPILLVYPFMQRFLQKGLILGAVKG